MKNKLVKFGLAAIALTLLVLSGCKKEPPTLDFIAEVDDFDVTFTVEATYVDTYEWDYGDGNTSNTAGGHTYTYSNPGDYTVTCKVTGPGGELSKSVNITIQQSAFDLLTGGSGNTDGKTWRLSGTATFLVDGASDIVPPNFDAWVSAMANISFPDSVLRIIEMKDEYANLYTFKPDGSMMIDPENGIMIAGYIYAEDMYPDDIVKTTPFGLYTVNYTPSAGMGFEIKKGDITMDIATEVIDNPDVLGNVTVENVKYIEFSGGGFIGILDYINKVVIRDISENRLTVTLFIHGSPNTPDRPSLAITVSFDAV